MYKHLIIFFVSFANLQVGLTMKACLKPPGVAIDQEFVKSHEKYYIIEHSGCDNCQKHDKAWTWIKPRTMSIKSCWNIEGTKEGKEFMFPVDCDFYEPGVGQCTIESESKDFTFKGSSILTHTDNKTYFAGALCIFGAENFWFIASAEESMSAADRVYVKEGLRKQGFHINKLAKEGDEIHFKYFVPREC